MDCLGHGDSARPGILADLLKTARADSPPGRVHDARQRGVVGRIGEEPQVRHQVANFRAVEEGLPPAYLVGHAHFHEFLFEWTRLMVGAVEDGEVAVTLALLKVVGNQFGNDALGLFQLRGAGDHLDGVPVAELAPEVFLERTRVLPNQGIGELENSTARTVVLLELDESQVAEIRGQSRQVLRHRTAPGVDGLIVVSNRHQAGAAARKQSDQIVLSVVGVLVFVDQQVADARSPLRQHILVGG